MPTGSFADKFGRHRSITISSFALSAGLIIYFLANSFWLFILAEVIAGLGRTFVSGALEAWLVDSLKAQGDDNLKAKVFRQESYFSSAGVIIGSILGAYVGNYNLAWPWLMGAILAIISGLYSLTLKESYHKEGEIRVKASLSEQIKIACSHGLRNRNLLGFMILGAVMALAVQALNMQWTIVFQTNFHLETRYLGWIFAGIALMVAIGGNLSKHSQRFVSDGKKTLAITQIATAILIIITAQITGLITTLSFFFLHELSRGAFKPLKQTFFNDQLLSETRATVLSLDSMINKIGSLIGLLISGFLAEVYSIKVAWLVSGIFLFIVCALFLIPKKTNKNGLI
jgi:MFS family permease